VLRRIRLALRERANELSVVAGNGIVNRPFTEGFRKNANTFVAFSANAAVDEFF
jgi:hypothetical protein